jgi:1-acyl-sn-glycerol-3-phosphate acyltransferase
MSGFAYPKAGPARWVGSILFVVWMFGLAIVMGILCLPLLLGARRPALDAIKVWMKGVLSGLAVTTGLEVEVRGRENLPEGACLVAAKHQGMLDILPPFTYLDDPAFVLKQSLMGIPIFGWFAGKAGMIAIDREGAAKTMRAMLNAASEAASEGRQVLIFPEGTRKAPGDAPDYQPGVAGLYRELNVPCVPVATNSGRFWPASGLLKYPGRAVFEILQPIPPGLKRAEFMRRLQADIEAASARLLSEG